MNSFKNLTAIFLAVLMLASVAVIGVSAVDDENVLNVSASSNIGVTVEKSYDTSVDTEVVVNFKLTCENPIANSQGYVMYDESVLELKSFALSKQLPNPVYNTDIKDVVKFNSTSDDNTGDFTQGASFVMATFKILKAGNTTVALNVEELNGITQEYNTYGIVSNGTICEGINLSGSTIFEPDPEPTEPTEPTESTEATQAPETSITVSAAKKTIYVNGTTTVTATVVNASGNTTFTSSNTKVATVASNGKVTGKKAGTVTITATNNGKSDSVQIKVIKRANTMKAKAKSKVLNVKYNKKTTFKKTKAFKITGAKGTVTFKKASGNSKITVSKKGVVTVKKGIKKGAYSVKVKVTAKGNNAYKAKTQKVTLKFKVK